MTSKESTFTFSVAVFIAYGFNICVRLKSNLYFDSDDAVRDEDSSMKSPEDDDEKEVSRLFSQVFIQWNGSQIKWD